MSADPQSLDTLIEEYKEHQRRTRGLRERTVRGYEQPVRFVRSALRDDPIDPGRLCGADVVGFVTAMRGRFSPRSVKAVRTALPSFFRFLRVAGLCEEHLEAALPAVAHWRLSSLPRALSDEQLGRVLASLDAPGPCRRRDRAIVTCLATLGLGPILLA